MVAEGVAGVRHDSDSACRVAASALVLGCEREVSAAPGAVVHRRDNADEAATPAW